MAVGRRHGRQVCGARAFGVWRSGTFAGVSDPRVVLFGAES